MPHSQCTPPLWLKGTALRTLHSALCNELPATAARGSRLAALLSALAYLCVRLHSYIYVCACATALAPFPRLESFYRLLESKAEAHFEKRASEAQMGFRDAIDYMAAVNTPFPWAKHSKTRG